MIANKYILRDWLAIKAMLVHQQQQQQQQQKQLQQLGNLKVQFHFLNAKDENQEKQQQQH